MPASLAAVGASEEAFVQAVGGCYEKSPWVAERAFAQGPTSDQSPLKKKKAPGAWLVETLLCLPVVG